MIDTVQAASDRVRPPHRLAIHARAGDRGVHDATWRQALHARGILPVGIPKTRAPINLEPRPEVILDLLHASGFHRKRTPYHVPLACACGSSRPVVERPIASVLSRGAGHVRYKGLEGAVVQRGMAVMTHHGAAMVRIRQQRLSKRAQKFHRLLGLRRYNVNQSNDSKNG